MDCLVSPVSVLMRRRSTGSRLGYRPLTADGYGDLEGPVTVVVGREKKVFLVEPFVLEEYPFQVLMKTVKKDAKVDGNGEKRMIFVDVDAILFEHMLWLMHNDWSSFFKLNLKEIIDFYAQDF